MPEKSSNVKSSQHNSGNSSISASAGPNGIAISPPSYDLLNMDRSSSEARPVQEQTGGVALQMKASASAVGGNVGFSGAENRTGLPDALKSGIESLSGLAMDDVQVHYNSPRPAQLQAFAYTQGTQIHVAPGQERHLPHEAWHVVQQKQGRVRATLQAKGVAINDDGGLEHEADLMGVKALQVKASQSSMNGSYTPASADMTVQRAESSGMVLSSPDGSVTQLAATKLGFGTGLTGRSKITSTHHIRSGVHGTAVNWVLTYGAWTTVPAGEVCNHSKAYDPMAQKILDEIHDKRLYKAAETVKDIYEELQGKDEGIGAATSTHANRMQAVIDDPDDDVNADDITDSFNYYLYKIGDYPRNLFFWPARTGGDPDNPVGEYGDHGKWVAENGVIGKKTRLSREKKRLSDARADLVSALP